jgi:hypothetical protein
MPQMTPDISHSIISPFIIRFLRDNGALSPVVVSQLSKFRADRPRNRVSISFRMKVNLFYMASRPFLGPVRGYPRLLPHGEATEAPPSACFKTAWSFTSTPPFITTAFCLIRHKDNFSIRAQFIQRRSGGLMSLGWMLVRMDCEVCEDFTCCSGGSWLPWVLTVGGVTNVLHPPSEPVGCAVVYCWVGVVC